MVGYSGNSLWVALFYQVEKGLKRARLMGRQDFSVILFGKNEGVLVPGSFFFAKEEFLNRI